MKVQFHFNFLGCLITEFCDCFPFVHSLDGVVINIGHYLIFLLSFWLLLEFVVWLVPRWILNFLCPLCGKLEVGIQFYQKKKKKKERRKEKKRKLNNSSEDGWPFHFLVFLFKYLRFRLWKNFPGFDSRVFAFSLEIS